MSLKLLETVLTAVMKFGPSVLSNFELPVLNGELKRPMRVLLVEDDRPLRGVWETILEANGYEVYVSGRVETALDLILKAEILILDWHLEAEMTGSDILSQWVQERRGPACVVSGSTSPEELHSLYLRGALNVFPKPLDVGVLLATMYRYSELIRFQLLTESYSTREEILIDYLTKSKKELGYHRVVTLLALVAILALLFYLSFLGHLHIPISIF